MIFLLPSIIFVMLLAEPVLMLGDTEDADLMEMVQLSRPFFQSHYPRLLNFVELREERQRDCGHLHDPCPNDRPGHRTCCIGLQCRYGKCLVQVGR
uniref:U57-Theraphotoxin-Sfo1a_1 n=1 Tax=Selenotholus foelschei TaxID=1905327 RepID=A0A482Z6P4_9ARAC